MITEILIFVILLFGHININFCYNYQMIRALLFDLSYTLLFPKDISYIDELNALYKNTKQRSGTYKFFDRFYLNDELIDFLLTRKNILELFMFTSGTIQNDPAIKGKLNNTFNDIFSAEMLSISKRDPEAYRTIAAMIHHKPKEVLFVDDSVENIDAAAYTGMQTLKYENNLLTIKYLNGLAPTNS